ncbi:MAG: TIGR02099 family protein [Thiobacillus sp.]|nr:TIGR02099 family protein [Thiobacillus sp.]
MPPRLILLLRRLIHYAFHAAGGAVIVVSLVALALKFWFMPDVDRFRPELEAAASRVVGVPVRIGALAADWHGINPRLTLRDVRLIPAAGEPLVLPHVEAVGSWLSLALLEPRLRRLDLEQARFPLRRAPDGIIYLAGIPINGPGGPSPFPDWLMRQSRIVVKDAQVGWVDEKLGAPPLQLNGVRLLMENGFGHHRFGGVAQPSGGANRLDLRGDFRGKSVHQPQSWSGRFYAQVGQARFGEWSHWVPWAQDAVKSGLGDLRFWFDLQQGNVVELTGDARLSDVSLSIRQDLPELRFEDLEGRIGWARENVSHTVTVDRLRFKLPDTPLTAPASLRVNLTPDDRGSFSRVEAEAGNLRLEALTALSGALPLPRQGHDLIESLAPRGLVESARGHWAGPRDYALHLDIREGGARAYASLPGLSGLDLKVDADQKGGKATLTGRDFRLDWPQVFRHELGFTGLDVQTDWRLNGQVRDISFQARRLANANLDGTAQGSIRLPERGSPVVDISAHLRRGEANAVYRYLPHAVSENAYNWLRRGLLSGHSDDTRLTLKGDLAHFPFDRGHGEFRVSVRMVDGVLDYAPGWPRIEGVHGMLTFHDKAMSLVADRGRIMAAQLGPVKVGIPDLHYSPEEIVRVEGYARGETQAFLDFVRQSPVDGYTGHFISPFSAQGPGVLALKLAMPVKRTEDTTVGGAFTFQNNTLRPGGKLPELSRVNGAITFTEKAVRGQGIQLRVLDMPARLDLDNQAGGLHVHLAGNASAEALRPHLPGLLAGRVRGAASWQADIGLNANGQTAGLSLASDLVGLALDLPAPLGKAAAQSMALQVNHQPEADGGDRVTARYGSLAQVNARLPRAGEARVNLHLGAGEASEPMEPGLWLNGNLRFLDLDTWRRQDWGLAALGTDDKHPLPFRQASLTFGELLILDRRLHDTHIRLQPSGKSWSLQMAGKEMTGELVTVPEQRGQRLLANFKRLSLPDPENTVALTTPNGSGDSMRLTNVELKVQSLAWKKRELGEMRLRLSPVKTGFQVDHFLLSPPEGRLEGKGMVSDHSRRPTQLQLKLSTQNLGKLLARLGYQDAIRGGEAELSGTLGWMGSPEDFEARTLEGDLELSARKGQFLKVDPGAGRLVGVLSLQSLPRRINLDFRDVFSQGFAFDEIAGKVHLEKGTAYTKDLRMNGPAAKVRMSGLVNLAQETQSLTLQIQPRLEDTVAVASAILGGPAVGLGALLANKVLKNPIGQAAGFEYTVSGSWKEPVIAKVPRKATSLQGESAP